MAFDFKKEYKEFYMPKNKPEIVTVPKANGFRILAEAMEKDLPYEIKCPSLLICGTKDHAGSCIRYNREWHRKTKIPLKWIEGAGHNSNTDKPEMINSLIEEFLSNI